MLGWNESGKGSVSTNLSEWKYLNTSCWQCKNRCLMLAIEFLFVLENTVSFVQQWKKEVKNKLRLKLRQIFLWLTRPITKSDGRFTRSIFSLAFPEHNIIITYRFWITIEVDATTFWNHQLIVPKLSLSQST